MKLKDRFLALGLSVVGMAAVPSAPALAGSHLWRINEIFSNADGSVQFIELKECCGANGETALAGKPLHSVGPPFHTFTFPNNLVGPTGNKHLLLATPEFAALPGAPTPNYTFAQAPFFKINGDTIEWAPLLNYDEFTFAPGALPLDGINSIRITNYTTDTFVTGPNSPTNYAGQTGSVFAGCPDGDGDGYGNPGDAVCSGGPQTDCDDTDPDISPGDPEVCNDDIDNDCDDQVDCTDDDCDGNAACKAIPAVTEWGYVVMVLLVITAATTVFARRAKLMHEPRA